MADPFDVQAFLTAAKVGAHVLYTEGDRTCGGRIEAIEEDEHTVTLKLDTGEIVVNRPP